MKILLWAKFTIWPFFFRTDWFDYSCRSIGGTLIHVNKYTDFSFTGGVSAEEQGWLPQSLWCWRGRPMPLTFVKTAVRWESRVNLSLVGVPLIWHRVIKLRILYESANLARFFLQNWTNKKPSGTSDWHFLKMFSIRFLLIKRTQDSGYTGQGLCNNIASIYSVHSGETVSLNWCRLWWRAGPYSRSTASKRRDSWRERTSGLARISTSTTGRNSQTYICYLPDREGRAHTTGTGFYRT